MPWDFWLIFLILGVVIPWRGRVRLRHLLARPTVGTKEKLALYGSTIAFQWLLVVLVAWRAHARGLTPEALGVSREITVSLLLWAIFGGALVGIFQWFNLKRVGRMTGAIPDLLSKLAESILPNNSLELAVYCTVSVTAGVCEEFLYRGFAMAALSRAGIASWAVVLLSAILFGLAHTYQGRSGVAGTTLLGLVFGGARLALQSLLPVIVWHTMVDVVAGRAGPKYLGASRKIQ